LQVARRGSVTTRAGPKPGVDGVPYVATNRFVVPDKDPAVVQRLVSEIEKREKLMKTLPGYTSSALTSGPNEGEFSFTQEWETKQAYEDYMNHPSRRRSHMAAGVYQYLPKDKWSVPENFTPILPTPK
jgi:heme-degrading monooxygenase HmoA